MSTAASPEAAVDNGDAERHTHRETHKRDTQERQKQRDTRETQAERYFVTLCLGSTRRYHYLYA